MVVDLCSKVNPTSLFEIEQYSNNDQSNVHCYNFYITGVLWVLSSFMKYKHNLQRRNTLRLTYTAFAKNVKDLLCLVCGVMCNL